MLTQEQLQNLKPGDIIDIRGFVNLPLNNGNILAELRYEFDNRILPAYQRISTEFISLPSDSQSTATAQLLRSRDGSIVNSQSKYDPCRLFKEGDRVRYCERDGRKLFRLQDGAIYEVKSNEGDAGTVEIWLWKEVGRYGSYPYNVFELVTPLEEQEPYRVVRPENYQCVRIMKEKRIYNSIPFDEEECVYRTLEEAKAAAEAECDRLNAEWRKEQYNG